jgi:predicted DNA binding CopG/RHH family protein
MTVKPKKIPTFKNEDEERDFWATHSTLDYFDLSTARRMKFPNLKPSTKTISIRLPESLIDDLKILANKMDVPYQSLIKMYLARDVREERRAIHAQGQNLAVAEEPEEYGKKTSKK